MSALILLIVWSHILTGGSKYIAIAISDINGALVYQENQVVYNNTPLSIDINNLKNGVYFVSIYNNEMRQQQKIVVIK